MLSDFMLALAFAFSLIPNVCLHARFRVLLDFVFVVKLCVYSRYSNNNKKHIFCGRSPVICISRPICIAKSS